MPRRIEKCQCGHPVCKDWHVHPEAAVQSVKFTEGQARQVAHLLDKMDQAKASPDIDEIYDDPMEYVIKEVAEAQIRYGKGKSMPSNYIIPVSADLLISILRERVEDELRKERKS